ncbi:MAG: flagellar hook-basal body complex protein [Planctomycetota bacterium]
MNISGMDVGSTGMITAGDWISVVANNLANLQTNGFKRSDPTFQDIAYNVFKPFQQRQPRAAPLGVEIGQGVRLNQVVNDFTQGPQVQGRNMDVYIAGEGFFQVVDPLGNVFYTRLGSFQPKEDGAAGPINLQLTDGPLLLFPNVTLPGDPGLPTVAPDGVITQGTTNVGRIRLVRFINPDGLEQVGDLLFRETGASGPPLQGFPGDPGYGSTIDGFLEGSNVQLASELVELVFASQLFAYSAQSFQTGNQELETTILLAQGI